MSKAPHVAIELAGSRTGAPCGGRGGWVCALTVVGKVLALPSVDIDVR